VTGDEVLQHVEEHLVQVLGPSSGRAGVSFLGSEQVEVLRFSDEGVVVGAGAGLDLGEPLWDGARFTAVLVGAPGGLVPDLPLEDDEPVRFLPLLPMTPNEAAWKRVHGAAALEERWLAQGLDLRDPARREADLR
jgi:hypothetical protein